MKKISMLGLLVLATPTVLLAATDLDFGRLVTKLVGYMNDILLLLIGVAIVMFVFYVIKYFFRPDANRAEAGMYVLYAVIGFFVILSFWGIVNILQNTFGLKNEDNRPSSWESFTELFPPNGGSGGGNKAVGPETND